MAFAPHTNTDIHRHVLSGHLPKHPVVLGGFNNAETGAFSEYAENTIDITQFGWDADLPHIIYVQGGFRYARVLKTVVYVSVDEDEFGQPVIEKWYIKSHRQYSTDWIGKRV